MVETVKDAGKAQRDLVVRESCSVRVRAIVRFQSVFCIEKTKKGAQLNRATRKLAHQVHVVGDIVRRRGPATQGPAGCNAQNRKAPHHCPFLVSQEVREDP